MWTMSGFRLELKEPVDDAAAKKNEGGLRRAIAIDRFPAAEKPSFGIDKGQRKVIIEAVVRNRRLNGRAGING